MPPMLPLELQLDILRLALPPLVSISLRERAKACLAYALVHRSWTPVALQELHEHLTVTFGLSVRSVEAAAAKLAGARAGGWAVKRLHVDVRNDVGRNGDPDSFIDQAMRGGTVEELWMWDYDADKYLPRLLPDTLRRVHLNLQLSDRTNEILAFPFAHLTYLEIIDAALYPFPSMPQLTAFLCHELSLEWSGPDNRFLDSMPSLRNLALSLSRPSIATSIGYLPPTLRHLAYDADEQEDSPWSEDRRPLVANLAKNLVSCTTFGSRPAENAMSAMLEEECQKAGTRWTHVDYDSEWDSETWAWSVNAQ
ncbi:hypothetical protein RTBOTA2_006246 [Rhodotorula toruloides]|uniref:Proteophosphoglycan ppg4 n=1 Tax=Rhodotorula toruloides TaxID=5286 RepID=A0A2S9ZYL8_RHOTO|nr:hypothetical protein RTBOTA2_006246 [Rhodotorula toruloides]PRQ70856.1 hypothetical protein AAT19DRAFT_11013 [Rhodotorula toruloides]